jgi:hypothetical protein
MHPDDELASLRRLLDALESGSMKLLQNGRDVTQEEVAKLPSGQPREEVVTGAERLGHRGERRLHRGAAREDACLQDVEVVE